MRCLRLATSALKVNGVAAQKYFPSLVERLLPMLRSELMAVDAVSVWLAMSEAAFDTSIDHISSSLIAYCSLQLLQTACELDPNWTQESVTSQAVRCVDILMKRSVTEEREGMNGRSASTEEEDETLSTAAFTLAFPLLKSILIDQRSLFRDNKEELTVNVLQIIEIHLNPINLEVRMNE